MLFRETAATQELFNAERKDLANRTTNRGILKSKV